jgi:hypothetical protein
MLQAALKAQARGFHIFPVTPGGKTPHPKAGYRDEQNAFHGWGETATNDLNQIIRFWTQVDPNANVGIACRPSQLLVVDLDRPKEPWKLHGTEWAYLHQGYGPYVTGEDLFEEMCWKYAPDGSGPVGSTYTVRTGSGGLHLYYRWPDSWPHTSQASPVKGVIDVRGNGGQWGGYVLAEGCVTDSGPYQQAHLDARDIPLPPEWIRHLVAEKPVVKVQRVQGLRQPGAISWSGLVDSVRNAGEGNRNNALLWAARAMCSDGATEQEAVDTLGPAATEAGLPWHEIERTIQSGFRAQRHKEGR